MGSSTLAKNFLLEVTSQKVEPCENDVAFRLLASKRKYVIVCFVENVTSAKYQKKKRKLFLYDICIGAIIRKT